MKKISLIISSMLILLLTGCSSSGNSVETLKGWSFQYNEGTKDYSLFFGLCDKNYNYLSADADVAVRIENENGDIVYEGTTSITEDDFSNYTSQVAGERYLANVRIAESEIPFVYLWGWCSGERTENGSKEAGNLEAGSFLGIS